MHNTPVADATLTKLSDQKAHKLLNLLCSITRTIDKMCANIPGGVKRARPSINPNRDHDSRSKAPSKLIAFELRPNSARIFYSHQTNNKLRFTLIDRRKIFRYILSKNAVLLILVVKHLNLFILKSLNDPQGIRRRYVFRTFADFFHAIRDSAVPVDGRDAGHE